MTPDELDAIEATISESTEWDGYGLDRAQVSDLIAALREAWASLNSARALAARVCETTNSFIAELDEARSALDRVRALHSPIHRFGPDGTYVECEWCEDPDYPCATIRAIEGGEAMTEKHWLADRIMSSQSVRDAGLSWDQVVAVLRGMADYELWKGAARLTKTTDPVLAACRFCHAVADDIHRDAIEGES